MPAAQALQQKPVLQTVDTYDEELTEDNPPPAKLGGVFFWMTAGLAILKDLVVDPLALAGQATGLAMSATVIGAVAGIPLWLVSWGGKIFFGLTVTLICYVYFWTHGGLHGSAKIKRLGVLILCFMTSLIPLAELLPEATFLFFFVATVENTIRRDNLIAHAARYGLDRFNG